MPPTRLVPRYRVSWKIALVFDGIAHRPTYHGRTHDLTLVGSGMLVHQNVYTNLPVVVLLAIPPLHRGHRPKVIEIRARQVYCVYSGETFSFRLGLEFDHFKAGGVASLKDGLDLHRPLISPQRYDYFPTTSERSPDH